MSGESYLNKLIQIANYHKNIHEWGGELSIVINGHRSCYDKMQDYLSNFIDDFPSYDKYLDKVQECIDKNNVVEIMFYPATPVGHISMFGPDIEEVAKSMVKSLEEDYGVNYFIGYTVNADVEAL